MPDPCKKCVQQRTLDLVRDGVLPRPNDLECVDCGHRYDPAERLSQFHRYDHPKGYALADSDHVEAVCARCQRERQRARGWH